VKQSGPEYLPFCVKMDPRCVKDPCSYDAPGYSIFKMINKSLKSALRGKYIPVSQHDSWINGPSTKSIARSRVPVGLDDTYTTVKLVTNV
jgi:hypothetical protein